MSISGFLSDREILEIVGKDLLIDPFTSAMLRPSSIRLRLDSTFLVMRKNGEKPIDTRSSDTRECFDRVDTGDEPFLLRPQTFVLAASLEKLASRQASRDC